MIDDNEKIVQPVSIICIYKNSGRRNNTYIDMCEGKGKLKQNLSFVKKHVNLPI